MITDLDRIQQLVWDDCAQNPRPRVNGECGHCLGMGALTVEVPVNHPAFGKAFRCICRKNSMTKASVQAMMELEANMSPEDAQRFDWRDFDGWRGYDGAIWLARQIALGETPTDEDGVARLGLFLSGSNGIGKTTIAAIIFRYWAARGANVVWQDYTRLIKRIQATYNNSYDGPNEDELINVVSHAALLVLDDVGAVAVAQSNNPRASVNRIEIVDTITRYRHTHRLPTIITTNLDADQFEMQFESRVASRVFGMCHAVWLTSPVDMRRSPVRRQA